MKESTYTVTCEGPIPHLEVFTDHGIVRAPVRVDVPPVRWKLAKPVRNEKGSLVYMLPNGAEYIA